MRLIGVNEVGNIHGKQNRLAQMFKALAHPARIAIIQQLNQRPMPAFAATWWMNWALPRPPFHKHLKELKNGRFDTRHH